MAGMTECARRARAASVNHEAPEVVHALILDVAAELAKAGFPAEAREAMRVARTLVPMFGRWERKASRRWWRRQAPPSQLDHAARIATYRVGTQ